MLPNIRVHNMSPGRRRREKRAWQTKTVGLRLEGFVDWMGVDNGEPAEEEEMFHLATGFAARMRKWSATLEGEATSSFGEKNDLSCLLQIRALRRTRPQSRWNPQIYLPMTSRPWEFASTRLIHLWRRGFRLRALQMLKRLEWVPYQG